MTDLKTLTKTPDQDRRLWLDARAAELAVLEADQARAYAFMLPLSSLSWLLEALTIDSYSYQARRAFLDLSLYRLNRQLALQGWQLLQDFPENDLVQDFCRQAGSAWAAKDYSFAGSQALDLSQAPASSPGQDLVASWLDRLSQPADRKQIPAWIGLLTDSLAAYDSYRQVQASASLQIFLTDYFLDRLATGPSLPASLDEVFINYGLVRASRLAYSLLAASCSRQSWQPLVLASPQLLEEHIFPWSDQSAGLLTAYLLGLEPSAYAASICDRLRLELSREDLEASLSRQALARWQQREHIDSIKGELAGQTFKIDSLSPYLDLITDLQLIEPAEGKRVLLVFFGRLVYYDDLAQADQGLILPAALFAGSHEKLDIFEQIEARYAILAQAGDQPHSDAKLDLLKEGKGSQAILLEFAQGAPLLYARDILRKLLID